MPPYEILTARMIGIGLGFTGTPEVDADQKSPGLSISHVARRAACSFATAWQTARAFKLLQSA